MYEKQTFTDHETVLTAAHLQHMEEGIAGALPATGWNAGKYLATDETGAVVETEAPQGGGAAAWEEISNNPFVESEREVLPEQEIAITLQDAEAQMYGWMVTPATFSLIPGKTHRILWDGTEYHCTGQGEAGEVALGNLLYLTGDETMDTGEPFLFYVASFEENGETVSVGICATNDTEETTHRAQIWVTDKNPLLPSVSSADEGKLLQVVEGAWTPVWPDTEAGDAVPVHIDLSNYKTQGTIVESFSEGTVATTTVTFDTEGRPSSITSPDGHYTTIHW